MSRKYHSACRLEIWLPNAAYVRGFVIADVEWSDGQANGVDDAGSSRVRGRPNAGTRAAAARQFIGADCGLCKDPAWQVDSKNMDHER
jgi:hypothetical protein